MAMEWATCLSVQPSAYNRPFRVESVLPDHDGAAPLSRKGAPGQFLGLVAVGTVEIPGR